MDFDLSEEHRIIRDVVRDFAEKEIRPVVDQDEKEHRFQRDLIRKMGDLGFFGCPIPEGYGGTNAGFLAHSLITEEVSRVSGSLRASFNMQTMGTSRQILQYGNEEQKKKYIPKLVKVEWLGCIGITEPNAGSDVAGIQTTAIRKADRYILNGSKNWITYAPVAEVGIIYAYTNTSTKYKGMSAFIVHMKSHGISTTIIEGKMGWNACPTGEIFFDDAEVPKENLLGSEGEGFKYAMGGLDNTRLTATAGAVGAAQGLLEEAINYSKARQQFGRPIGKFQMVQEQIACMVVEIEAARLLTYKCAVMKDKGIKSTLETSIAKCFACEVASRVADSALQILGAYGCSKDYPVERYFRDAKLYQIMEGSANIHKIIIANDALGYKKANQ
jgi:glutaryl-CoA dehydrogenase (non-decarboxylating)